MRLNYVCCRTAFLGIALALVFSAEAPLAQINTADLLGRVTDSTGAFIQGARVSADNLATGWGRETTTQEAGEYLFLAVPPGRYRLTVEAQGFRPAVVQEVVLTIGQKAQLPFQLEISGLKEAVVVTADAALVETTRSSLATTINQRAIDNLPSNGRSYINFLLLDSATTRDNQPVLGPAPTSGLNIGGQRARANMVSIDGADAIDNSINGVRATLSQEAVQEFQILKSGYAAEYGRASSAVINILSKQGTNEWRGNLFGYLRSRRVSATNAFAGEPDPGDTRTQAGFTLGGPIKKDKNFLFLSFETNQRNSTNFSQVGRDNFGLKEIPHPLGAGFGTLWVTQQQETYIKSLNTPAPLALAYATIATNASRVALWGNTAGGPTSFGLIPNPLPASFQGLITETGNYRTTEETYFYSARFDHQFSGGHNLFLRVSASPSDLTGLPSNGQNQLTALNAFSRTTNSSSRDFAVVSQLASNLSPAWLNEFRFQFARRRVLLTTNGSNVAIEIPGVASTGQEPFAPLYRTEERWQFTENLTHIRGSHTYKMGIDFNRIPVRAIFPLNQGGLYYFPAALAVDDPIVSGVVASSLGPEVVAGWKGTGAPAFSATQAYGFGLPESFVQQFGGNAGATAQYKVTTLGWFIQDSWKLASNLSLNYGLRYDVEFTPTIPASSSLSEAGERLLGVMQGIPRDTNNWAPRLGLAWDPLGDGKTVVRGSYGLFYGHPLSGIIFLSDVVDGTQSPYLVAPHGVGADDLFQGRAFTAVGGELVNSSLGYISSQQRFDALSPAFATQETALQLSPILTQTLPVASNFEYDYTQQATLGVERQLNRDFSLAVDYTFAHGSHLLRPRNINQGSFALINAYRQGPNGPLGALWNALGPLAPLGEVLFNQFRGTGPNYIWANTVSQGALSKPVMDALVQAFDLPHAPGNAIVPFFSVKQYESSGASVYHGMTITLRKKFSQYYQLLGSWTWSHAIDDSTDLQTLQEPQDNMNSQLDRSNSNFDQRHRFVISGVFDSPWTSSHRGLLGHLLAHWSLSPTIELSSGRPYNLLTLNDRTYINSSSTTRPSVVPAGTPGSFLSPDGKVGLVEPPIGSVGNLGRNVYRTNAFASIDLRVTRSFPFGEGHRVDLSVDIFNLSNRVSIREVDTSFTQAGRPVGAFDPRQIQFSVKVVF